MHHLSVSLVSNLGKRTGSPKSDLTPWILTLLTGLESVEFDIRMIADKTIVVTHGPELENTKSTVEDLNWDEVQKIAIDENDLTSDTDGLLGTDFFPGENGKDFSGDSLKLAERLEQWVAEKISQEHQKSGNTNESQLHRVSMHKDYGNTGRGFFKWGAKLQRPSTANIDLILWHTHLNVCA